MWKFIQIVKSQNKTKQKKYEISQIGSPSLASQPTGTTVVSPNYIVYCLCPRGKDTLAKKHKVFDPPPSKQVFRT